MVVSVVVVVLVLLGLLESGVVGWEKDIGLVLDLKGRERTVVVSGASSVVVVVSGAVGGVKHLGAGLAGLEAIKSVQVKAAELLRLLFDEGLSILLLLMIVAVEEATVAVEE